MSFAAHIDQTDARLLSEVGIQAKYLNGERYLVDDALPGAVTAAEKLQVIDGVVLTIPIDVMDGFFGGQRSAKVPLHNVTMLQNIACGTAVCAGNNEANISALHMACRFGVSVFRLPIRSTEGRSASGAAQSLLAINSSSGPSLDGHWFAALDARNLPLLNWQSFGQSRTCAGAVRGVFAVSLAVFTQICWLHGEGFPTPCTSQLNGNNPLCRATMNVFKRIHAYLGTVAPRISPAAFHQEISAAMRALFFNLQLRSRHLSLLLFARDGVWHISERYTNKLVEV